MKLDILGLLSFLADLLPFVLLILNRELLKNKAYLFLFFWTIISIITDVFVVSVNANGQQLVAFYSILLEVFFIGIIYYYIVKKPTIRKVIITLTTVFTIICIIEAFRYKINGFPFWLASSGALLTLIISIFVLYDMYFQNKYEFLLNNPKIFIVFGYMIYVAGNIFLFASTETFPNIFKEPGLWNIFIIANIIKNSFLIKAVLEGRKGLKK